MNYPSFGFDPNTTKGATKNISARYPLLNKDENGLARKISRKYRGIIGILGYFQGTTRPDITMATDKCERFISHDRALKRTGRYLPDTRDMGMIYRPDTS